MFGCSVECGFVGEGGEDVSAVFFEILPSRGVLYVHSTFPCRIS